MSGAASGGAAAGHHALFEVVNIFADFMNTPEYNRLIDMSETLTEMFDPDDDDAWIFLEDDVLDAAITTDSLPLKVGVLTIFKRLLRTEQFQGRSKDARTDRAEIVRKMERPVERIVYIDTMRLAKHIRDSAGFDVIQQKKVLLNSAAAILRQNKEVGQVDLSLVQEAAVQFYNLLAEFIDPIDEDTNPALPVPDERLAEIGRTIPLGDDKGPEEVRTLIHEAGTLGGRRAGRRSHKRRGRLSSVRRTRRRRVRQYGYKQTQVYL